MIHFPLNWPRKKYRQLLVAGTSQGIRPGLFDGLPDTTSVMNEGYDYATYYDEEW